MNYLHAIREYVTPVLEKSNFHKTGMLTPKEFVEAGDFLVLKCPTWKWSSGNPLKRKDYLPKDKQYLVTKNVPCVKRCSDAVMEEKIEGDILVFEDPDTQKEPREIEDETFTGPDHVDNSVETDSDDDSCDVHSFDDPAAFNNNEIVRTRTYDIYVSYDNYYRTPRVWLYGYDESGFPLNKQEMFQDISPEHKEKTVTFEMHPHENYMSLSIHPCKHASTMKRMMIRSPDAATSVDQYMFLFLKFIGTTIPTISYDYSFSV